MRVVWLQAEFVGDVPPCSSFMEKLPNNFRAEEDWTQSWFLNVGQEYDLCVKSGAREELYPGGHAELFPVSITAFGERIEEVGDGVNFGDHSVFFAKTRTFPSIEDLFTSWRKLQFYTAPREHHNYLHRKVEIRLGRGFQIWPDDFTEDEKELLFPKIFG